MRRLNWTKCQGEIWCKLNSVNLDHDYFKYAKRGIYIIWHGGQKPAVVYIGQGDIKEELLLRRKDSGVQAYEQFGLYVTWAVVADNQLDGVQDYLMQAWVPKVGVAHVSNKSSIAVNFPWE